MAVIRLETVIAAPVERCFDLALDLDFHLRSLAHTGERAVAGRTSGLIELGESVTWEARHFGVRQRLTSKITAMDRPRYFRDEMTKGAFAAFAHDHWFEPRDDAGRSKTVMVDEILFRSPLGPLGGLVDFLVMKRYLRRLMERRNRQLTTELESEAAPAYDDGHLRGDLHSREHG
jgi:ligand-binding SRPBCC domain-containing protein